MKIGVMFGNPETTTGGNALKFYSSVRLDVRRIASLKKGEVVIGNRTLVKVVKNKMAPPFARAEFDLLYDEGISQSGELLDLAVKENVIEKAGSWFSFEKEKLGQGKEAVRLLIKENKTLKSKLEQALKKSQAQNASLDKAMGRASSAKKH